MDEQTLRETKIHGTPELPFIVYHGKIPDFIASFPRHWHEEMEIIYVARGRLRVTVWSRSYLAQPEDLVIILPEALHSIEQVGAERAEYYNILFHFSIFGSDACSKKYLKPFLTHESSLNCFEEKGSALNGQLRPLILSLIEHRRGSYTTDEYLVRSHLYMIMHLLNRHRIRPGEGEQTAHHKLKTALYHIRNSYANPITVKEAADLCGFSESHFMKLFRELTGTSFTACLIDYRLELAAAQLLGTDLKIIDIAANCGFHNHSYFTRAFAKKYGMTPAKYRKSPRQPDTPAPL